MEQKECNLVTHSNPNFELLIYKPNDSSNLEARIYIFNVTEETSLDVTCIATEKMDGESRNISSNTVMVEFIMSPSKLSGLNPFKLSCLPLTIIGASEASSLPVSGA